MIGLAALVVGIVLGLVFHPSVPEVIQPYLPIAVVAALDAVFGGLRAYLERIFDPKVFVVSFVFNVLVAALIVYVGDQLGVGTQLSTAIIVVLGIRIFGNTAALRRRLFGPDSDDRSTGSTWRRQRRATPRLPGCGRRAARAPRTAAGLSTAQARMAATIRPRRRIPPRPFTVGIRRAGNRAVLRVGRGDRYPGSAERLR
ncbi:hypothetical protein I553_6479 [Mycobacterium xenopi 4042]|uniref:Small basic family protein n=1 Tax=Mycobacterium xenopi 4042 TaxID=1299334 RepID=X8BFG1_MYCXE|nr:hypothetical protein I552_6304 [Mycobacterium xenopi 3993]EUA42619.1 hypothetical protein I553_6479 [Mycobacterium xenopi 4042]